ncbi:MAG: SAM-dependent methyltransferase [Steroidobacteraceae bacterium]
MAYRAARRIRCSPRPVVKGPLVNLAVQQALLTAVRAGARSCECSLDLDRTTTTVQVYVDGWDHEGHRYPFVERCKERTIYAWSADGWQPVARFGGSLIKLVPTEWGAPTFEIDGIKMLPTAKVSPYADAERKVGLVQPRGKVVLDTCGGLGYFAAWCLKGGATRILSFEKNPDVIWLRSVNPWSPDEGGALELTQGDIAEHVTRLADASVDAILHDPPRFGIAGELYSQVFYDHLSRVLRRKGRLFHYTGTPNKLTTGRDVPNEVAKRLRLAGFRAELNGDGVLAIKR